jgi:signal transduction histidine kinase
VSDDTYFARLVSLGCHDVRTPLATVHGFAKTLERVAELAPPADRYLQMIGQASAQMAELLDVLSLAARIESGRYEPALREADTLALAQTARERLGEDLVQVSGEGATF